MNTARARGHLSKGNLHALFIEELGWDHHAAKLRISFEGLDLELQALAQKRGMVAFHCPTPFGQRLPDYRQRRKIEQQVAKSALEHMIVFTDASAETQIWQWVKREPGKPVACREHNYRRGQPGDSLVQKLGSIAFTLAEEERLALPDVTQRARTAFDVERVTKRFYEQFQKEHAAFLKLIAGIDEVADREWYASVMLNRLMFVYFIQRKGFLAGDRDYLRNRLAQMGADHGKDKFYSFYRYFLLRLFHEGLGGREREPKPKLEALLGRIPYLNGGLFDVHELEKPHRYGKAIQIPDRAFERIFRYFDQYQWHLDERPLRADNEINPDVLGYIFEKYINQKQMGAYYTKEDITEYISKNTVLPFIFDAARAKCRVAFENSNGPAVWDLLREDPDRYIYAKLRHGSGESLPAEIAVGVNPPTLDEAVGDGAVRTIELRKGWNKPAPATHALPTESWREVIGRLSRYEDVKAKLAGGEVREVSDLITLNLDIRQFAQDVVENCEGPDLLRAFWQAIERITILDPTCGSGAFLFAALNILEPLYEACLGRMEAFVEDLARSGEKHRPEKFSDFRKILERVATHPNRRYFIFKSIILNNLFGVDIMEEAVEICKLRLFLKLAAQVEPDATKENLGIEPLPDIDFNVRAGNTLVGYATQGAVKLALTQRLDFDDTAERIEVRAADLHQSFNAFRSHQIEGAGSVPPADKEELHRRLKALDDELNLLLSSEYGVAPGKRSAFTKWLRSHQPFHWFVEFYGIMASGGFDVIVGNPPYVEYKDVNETYTALGFRTEPCGDLYALCTERALELIRAGGSLGLIVPISIFGTDGFEPLQRLALTKLNPMWVSCFANRPSQLFEGAQKRITILLGRRAGGGVATVLTTQYLRWRREEFENLFRTRISYAQPLRPFSVFPAALEKLGSELETQAFGRLAAPRERLASAVRKSARTCVYYTRKFGYFLAFLDFVPKVIDSRSGKRVLPSELKEIVLSSQESVNAAVAALSSSTFYWFWTVLSDCRNLNRRDLLMFPLDPECVPPKFKQRLAELGAGYLAELRRNSKTMLKAGLEIETFEYAACKPGLDAIDSVLAAYYGFSEEELDFVINYDFKYRMGAASEAEVE